MNQRSILLFAGVGLLYALTGFALSWNVALTILALSLLSALMALGVNMQWGYAGLFSTGIVGFVALGGLMVVFVSGDPVPDAFGAQGPGVFFVSAGWQMILALAAGVAVVAAAVAAWGRLRGQALRGWAVAAILIGGFFLYRAIFDPAITAIESFNPATFGNVGGLGVNSIWAWPIGGLAAAAAAWAIGKVALGLREDYLAIATLGIAEIIIAAIKSEDWMARGVKNFINLPRPWPVPYEVEMQKNQAFLDFCASLGLNPVTTSTISVQLIYITMFAAVLAGLILLLERMVNSPWGRMMRAIRDNEVSAAAMGKDVTRQHLMIFILGSAVVGMAGAMYVSYMGQLVPGEFSPLRFTFSVWIMVIVGGSGNNWGTVLGALLMGWLWLMVDNAGPLVMGAITQGMADGPLKSHLIDVAPQMRTMAFGAALLLVLRFAPRGLMPER